MSRVNPLSIKIEDILCPTHNIVMYKALLWLVLVGGIFTSGNTMLDALSAVTKWIIASGEVAISTYMRLKALTMAHLCIEDGASKPQMDMRAYVVRNCLSISLSSLPIGSGYVTTWWHRVGLGLSKSLTPGQDMLHTVCLSLSVILIIHYLCLRYKLYNLTGGSPGPDERGPGGRGGLHPRMEYIWQPLGLN